MGWVCYFTVYFVAHCYVTVLVICCVWVYCKVIVCFCCIVALHARFHIGCLHVMAGLSNSQFFVLKLSIMSYSVPVVLSLDSWSLMYCSHMMSITFTYLLFPIISHLIFVMCVLYDQSLWLLSPLSSIISWVHSPQYPLWTATVDPLGKEIWLLRV